MPLTYSKGMPLPMAPSGGEVKPVEDPLAEHDVVLPMGTPPTHPSAAAGDANATEPNARTKDDATSTVRGFFVFIAASLRGSPVDRLPAEARNYGLTASTKACGMARGNGSLDATFYGTYVPPSCRWARHLCAFLMVQLMPSTVPTVVWLPVIMGPK